MPVLMRLQRLLETGSLARWLALPPSVPSRHLADSASGTTVTDPMVVLSESPCKSQQHDCGKQRILKLLNLEDTPLKHPAPSRLRDREAHVRASVYPVPSDSIFPLTHLRTRHGDSSALSDFANNPWKIYQSVGA